MVPELWSFITSLSILPFENIALSLMALASARLIRNMYRIYSDKDVERKPDLDCADTPSLFPEKFRPSLHILNELRQQLPLDISQKVRRVAYFSNEQGSHANNIQTKINWKGDQIVVALGENAVDVLSPKELKAILAHELSHASLNHLTLPRTFFQQLNETNAPTLFLSGGAAAFLSFKSLFYSQEQLPSVVCLFLLSVTIGQIFAHYSQIIELEADKESIKFNPHPEALITGLKKIHTMELARFESIQKAKGEGKTYHYHDFFPDHPSVEQRAKALGVKTTVGSGLSY
jgi:Zn-dependent protease with chaperone function